MISFIAGLILLIMGLFIVLSVDSRGNMEENYLQLIVGVIIVLFGAYLL